jgi:hypothetical protein
VFDLVLERSSKSTAGDRVVHSRVIWRMWISIILTLSVLTSIFLYQNKASPSLLAWLIYFLGVAAIIYRPRYGVYLILFFGLAGDGTLTPWFPFVKGFSSRETLLYVNDSLIFSPLETYIVLTFISWFARSLAQRNFKIHVGALGWPALLFLAFSCMGLVYGIGTGGNVTIALWEARPIFYLVAMVFLASNLLVKREHISHLFWAAALALLFEAIIGDIYYLFVINRDLAGIESITEHSAAVHIGAILVLTMAVWLYKTPSNWRKYLIISLPVLLLLFIADQRRAAFISLAVALVLFGVALFLDNRRVFYFLAPPLLIIAAVYVAMFWNSSGAIGLPARAIKSVIVPDQATYRDQASNAYRIIENINTGFTVHQRPLTGVGFGQKFFILVPMADISFFIWWQYLPHNSIIWIWLKMGVGGFCAMLFMVGSAIFAGTRVYLRMPKNQLRAFALTATLYIIMHFIYAYVDISWDSQSMLFVGAMFAVINSLEGIASQPLPPLVKRWPWQPDPQPEPEILV